MTRFTLESLTTKAGRNKLALHVESFRMCDVPDHAAVWTLVRRANAHNDMLAALRHVLGLLSADEAAGEKGQTILAAIAKAEGR